MMEPFFIRLAGKTIEVSALFPKTKTFCSEYLSDGEADFSVCITPEDIAFEYERAMKQGSKESKEPQQYSDTYLETLALYRKIADKLVEFDTLLVHGSAIAVDGQGYLFTAPSGTGKSTHTRLWREMLCDRAVMINDDKPLISLSESGAYIHGTPWCGKHRLHTNISVPLKAICILERGEMDHIEPMENEEAVPILLQQTHRPQNTEGMYAMLSSVEELMKSVGLYRMKCTINPTAAQTAFAVMSQKDETI